jgi:hypothetical protein
MERLGRHMASSPQNEEAGRGRGRGSALAYLQARGGTARRMTPVRNGVACRRRQPHAVQRASTAATRRSRQRRRWWRRPVEAAGTREARRGHRQRMQRGRAQGRLCLGSDEDAARRLKEEEVGCCGRWRGRRDCWGRRSGEAGRRRGEKLDAAGRRGGHRRGWRGGRRRGGCGGRRRGGTHPVSPAMVACGGASSRRR